jgi:hypothetical protein
MQMPQDIGVTSATFGIQQQMSVGQSGIMTGLSKPVAV